MAGACAAARAPGDRPRHRRARDGYPARQVAQPVVRRPLTVTAAPLPISSRPASSRVPVGAPVKGSVDGAAATVASTATARGARVKLSPSTSVCAAAGVEPAGVRVTCDGDTAVPGWVTTGGVTTGGAT